MVQAVLFDLGDTLFSLKTDDPRRFLLQGVQIAYAGLTERGYELPPLGRYLRRVIRSVEWAYLWSQVTLREIQLLDLILRTHRRMGVSLDRATAEDYARWCHQPIREMFTAAPGAHWTLERVREAGYAIGLVSNTFMISQAMDEDLTRAGVIDYFQARVYSCDVGYAKPSRQVFEVAVSRLGVPAARIMFVGDLINVDIKGAKRLGMATVLITPDGRIPPGRHRPDHIIRRITEVPALLPKCRAL